MDTMNLLLGRRIHSDSRQERRSLRRWLRSRWEQRARPQPRDTVPAPRMRLWMMKEMKETHLDIGSSDILAASIAIALGRGRRLREHPDDRPQIQIIGYIPLQCL